MDMVKEMKGGPSWVYKDEGVSPHFRLFADHEAMTEMRLHGLARPWSPEVIAVALLLGVDKSGGEDGGARGAQGGGGEKIRLIKNSNIKLKVPLFVWC